MNISNRLFFIFSVLVLFEEMSDSCKQKFCSVFFPLLQCGRKHIFILKMQKYLI